MSQGDSEICAKQNGNLERHEASKIKDAQGTRDHVKHFASVVVCCRASTREVKRQAEQRISSLFIQDFALINTQRYEQGYMQTDMKGFGRTALERKTYEGPEKRRQ